MHLRCHVALHRKGLVSPYMMSRFPGAPQLQVRARLSALLSSIPWPEIPHGEEGLYESIWLLLTSVVTVPLVCKLPGGSPVLGFLVRIAHAPRPCTAPATCKLVSRSCHEGLASQPHAHPASMLVMPGRS